MLSGLSLKQLFTSHKWVLSFGLFIHFFTLSSANPIDSLKQLYFQKNTDADYASLSLEIAKAYALTHQNNDSTSHYLQQALEKTSDPEVKGFIYLELHEIVHLPFERISLDSCNYYLNKARVYLDQVELPKLEARYYIQKGTCYLDRDDLSEAIKYFSEAEGYLSDEDTELRIELNLELAWLYLFLGDHDRGQGLIREALTASQSIQHPYLEINCLSNLATTDLSYEECEEVCKTGIALSKNYNYLDEIGPLYFRLGLSILEEKGDPDLAIQYFQQGLEIIPDRIQGNSRGNLHMGMMEALLKKNNLPRAKFHGKKAKELMVRFDPTFNIDLAKLYAGEKMYAKAFELYSENIAYEEEQDNLINHYDISASLLQEKFEKEKQAIKETNEVEISREREIRRNIIIALVISMLFLATLIWVYFSKQKANQELRRLNKEILEQKSLVEQQNNQLKITQQQLIQSEKMASLGQLTAGIAHEIKNPLNFVNNFAKFSKDLAGELKETLAKYVDKMEKEDAVLVEGILEDLQENTYQINQHGQRADGIVQSMMNHASGAKGKRQSYNINTLVEESTNLAYKGYRISKKETVDILIHKQFDEDLAPLMIIPQEMSRVIVNLFNNACDAVMEKQKEFGENFQPEITLSTKKENEHIVVSVKDNGNGISKELREKIFDPFYTTKPTGEGNTGLGLSISHDIVVQGHNGTFELSSQEGDYTEFLIRLPIG